MVSKGRLSAVRGASDSFLDNGLENWKQSISHDVNIIPQEPSLLFVSRTGIITRVNIDNIWGEV